MKHRRPYSAAFGLVVREARERADLTQERLAFKAGIHPTYLNRVENGRASPALEVMVAIARALRAKAHSLLEKAENRIG